MMNIVTIFNYPDDEKFNTMFKIWLVSVLYNKDKTVGDLRKVRILTKELTPSVYEFIVKLGREDVEVVLREDDVRARHYVEKARHNIGFKLFNLCKEVEPYIYLDSDMLILTPFTDILNASKEKTFISVNHQTIPGHTSHIPFKFINTGFYVLTEPSLFDYEEIISLPLRFRCPGTDQMLIYNFLRTKEIDYTHRKIHYGWNSCAGFKKITDRGVVADGIPEKHPVHILHYWFEYKPWIKPCPIYSQYAEIVKESKPFQEYVPYIESTIPNTRSLFS